MLLCLTLLRSSALLPAAGRRLKLAARVLGFVVPLALLSASLGAQVPRLRCVINDTTPPNAAPAESDGVCVIALPQPAKASDPQHAVIRIAVFAPPSTRVGETLQPPVVATFRADPREGAGAGTLSADTVTVSATGDAHVVWFRSAGGSTPAAVSVTVRTSGGTATRLFRIVPGEPPASPVYALENPNGDELDARPRWGFEKTRLRKPLRAEVREVSGSTTLPVTKRSVCTARRVLFRRLGTTGSVLPDTAIPEIVIYRPRVSLLRRAFGDLPDPADSTVRCEAEVRWALGDGPGIFEARAALVGRDSAALPVEYRAHARSLPKFIVALGGTRQREYVGLLPPTAGSVRRFELPVAGGGTESFDSTLAGAGPDTVTIKRRARSNAILGLSFAPGAHRLLKGLTGMAGVDPAAPADNWYAGLSLLRLFAYTGLEVEHVPLDVFGTVNYGRVTRVKTPDRCGSARTAAACETEDPRQVRGWGLALSLDATSLFTDAIKKVVGF